MKKTEKSKEPEIKIAFEKLNESEAIFISLDHDKEIHRNFLYFTSSDIEEFTKVSDAENEQKEIVEDVKAGC